MTTAGQRIAVIKFFTAVLIIVAGVAFSLHVYFGNFGIALPWLFVAVSQFCVLIVVDAYRSVKERIGELDK